MNQKKKQWTFEEIQLLQNIKKTHKEKKWKLISKNLAKKGYKRSEHECRHKWVNCLNPDISHGPWTEQQLQLLYSQYEKHHSQWSIIQKSLPNRTQIRIKNHFYGVLRNIMRFILKYFKKIPGKQSQISNRINPNTLQLIYRGQQQFTFIQGHIKNAIFSMEFHFAKQKLAKILEQNKEIYRQLNDKLLDQIQKMEISSEQYRKSSKSQQLEQKIKSNFKTQNDIKQVEQSIEKDKPTLKQQAIELQKPNYMNQYGRMYYESYYQLPPSSFPPTNPPFFAYYPQYQQNIAPLNYLNMGRFYMNYPPQR